MADQIKNAKMGEVSSQNNDNKPSSVDGATGGKPPRKEPVIKPKPERKLPVFANEVRQHNDDDFDDDVDFTSDSVAMPFAMGTIMNLDASEVDQNMYTSGAGRRKHKKAKKSKAKNKYTASKKELDDFARMDPTGAEQFDELSFMGGTMPQVGAMGVDNYLDLANAMSNPYGVDGYLDLNNALSKAYVPTYDKENALMAKQLGYDVDTAEVEPMPENRPFVEKGAKEGSSEKADSTREESEALLAEHKAEKQRKKDAAVAKAVEKADRRADELAALESNTPAKPEKVKKEKQVDPGIEEAEELLEAAEAEKQRKKELKSNDIFAREARKKFEEEFKAEWGDPGIVEAAELLAADKEERQRLKDQRRAKRNKGEEDAVVVETVSVGSFVDSDDDSAPLTGAASGKKIVVLVPNGESNQSAVSVVVPADADIEAYSVGDLEEAGVAVNANDAFVDKYDHVKGNKADRRAEREELSLLAAAMKQQKKEDKAFDKAQKAAAWDKAAETVYSDVEPYYPEEKPAPAPVTKVKKEFSTAAYDRANDRKQNKAAVAAALVAFYSGNKPVQVKKVKTVSAPEEVIYPDVDYTEGYDPNWAEKQEAAEAAFREAKRLEREAAKADNAEKREAKNQTKYESHEAKMLREREERDSLLLTYKEEKEHKKALKAAEKANKGASVPTNVTEVIYDDFTELFDKEAYDADKAAEAAAVAEAKAQVKAQKDAKRQEKADSKEAKLVSAYERDTAAALDANARESEMDAIRKQYKAEAKARAKEEKEAEKAEKLAAKNAPKPEVVYADFTELFDKEAYDADKAAEAAAVEAVKAAAVAEKEAKRTEKAEKREAKMTDKYDTATEKSILKAEKKDELKTLGNESIKENKERKAEEKAAEKAEKLAAKNAPKPEVIYDDFTELFDKEAYDADKAAEAAAVEAVKAAALAEKEAKRHEKAEKKEAKIVSAYEKDTEATLDANARESEMDAIRKQYKAEAKARAKEEKEAEKAEKLAAKNAPKPEVVYADFTELFDKEAYDADKAAEAAVVAEAKAKVEAEKEAKRTEKAEKREAKMSDKYDAAVEKAITKAEKKDELKTLGNESIKENKERKAEEKAAEKAEKLAAKNAPKPEVIYDDFTELFDKEAYDAEKAAEAAVIAEAKAAAVAEKEAKRHEKAEKKDAKLVGAYEKETAAALDANEREEAMDTFRKQYNAEAKARAKEEKAAEKAEKLAAKNAPKPEVIYDDFTELFDKEAYDAEKAAEAAAVEAVKAAAVAEKAAKRQEKADKLEEKIAGKYDTAVDKALTKAEKKAELKTLGNESIKENKERKAEEKAAEKAEKLAAKNAPKPEVIYPDFTETFDAEAYYGEKAAQKAAEELAKREAKENKLAEEMAKELDVAVKEYEMDAFRKQYKAEDKARAKEAKEAAEAQRLEKLTATKPVGVYADFTELFDKEAYDAEKQAVVEAKKQAEADEAALKEAKRNEKNAARENKLSVKYDAAVDKAITKAEKKDELKTLGKESIKENKERKAEEKAAEKAEKLAAKNAPKPEVIYDDFTELFDKEAYDAEKAAEAAAVAAIKAAALAQKEAKRQEKADKQEAKIVNAYEKETAATLDASEREEAMDAFRKQYTAEEKARTKEEKAAAKAEKLAAKNAPKPEVIYPDLELVYGEVDAETKALLETAPEDVLEGARPKTVTVRELTRAAKEDKQLQLLIKKDKGTIKRVKHDLETLELAEKYVDDGAIEMADAKTVVRDAKQFDKDVKDQRVIKEYDNEIARELEGEEKLRLAAEYKIALAKNKKRVKRAKKYGKFMLEYGSTYDPEWDGEFNNYGLPEVHPYTEGVKLAPSRRRTPKKEKLSYFNKKNLSALAREQCDTDLKMIEARVEYDYTTLELEVNKFAQDFSGEFKGKKEKRWFRQSKDKLKNFKQKLASAVKYEKFDNERYYSVVATDFARAELPEKADRDELIAMREEVMRLLDIRDEINGELIELYTGSDGAKKSNTKGRARVTLKARKRAHMSFVRYFRVLNKRRVTRNEKMRIFDKMDEIVELKGDIAKIRYILRKERPTGKLKRDYRKELKRAKRDVRILKKSVERSTVKALKRAKKREVRMWTMIFAYSVFIALALFVIAMVTMGPEILRASKLIFPENLHQYIDLLLNNWPL